MYFTHPLPSHLSPSSPSPPSNLKSFKDRLKLGNLLSDVPDPPDRPLISNFTSRSVRLSWVASRNSHNNPILYYVIETQ